ncbi:MAG TPA: hypothetical protein VIO32_01400 [Candidatus Baltobacteraceae bacterium]
MSAAFCGILVAVLAACVGGPARSAQAEPQLRHYRSPASRTIAQRHVQTWAYWAWSSIPVDPRLNARWLSAHVDYLETNEADAAAFRAAGGKHTVGYSDPFKVIPSRGEPMHDLPEKAWLHAASGARAGRAYGTAGIQQFPNPLARATVREFREIARGFESRGFDTLEVDDVNWDIANVYYQAPEPGTEIGDDAAYDRGTINILRSSPLPVFFNGLGNADQHYGDISGNVRFLPYVTGGMFEGCFYTSSRGPSTGVFWTFTENTLLYTTGHNKKALCIGTASGEANASPRQYFLASWWLSYDARRSIAFPLFPSAGNVYVFPEFEIVPTRPLQSATRNISELQSGGAYLREFAACYQSGRLIGSCAAVVNPTDSDVPMPGAVRRYSRMLYLDAENAFEGGRAEWIPITRASVLPAASSLILLRPPA